jgi:hypothetical protein
MKKKIALAVVLLWGGVAQSQEKEHIDVGMTMLGGGGGMGYEHPKPSAPLASVTVLPVHKDKYGRYVVSFTNNSNLDMTAVGFDIPDRNIEGMSWAVGEFIDAPEFLHPGATADLFLGGQEKESYNLIPSVVVYADLSTEGTNKDVLTHIRAHRESTALAYERAVELAATTSDPEKLADKLQAESDPPQQGHGMPPLIKKNKTEMPAEPSPEAKSPAHPMPDLGTLHQIAQNLVDGRTSVEEIKKQAEKWRTHSKISVPDRE